MIIIIVTLNYIILYELLVLDKNTLYHVTGYKQMIIDFCL